MPHLSFTLMLGSLFNTRAPVAAIGLGFIFAGQVLPNFLLFSWKLPELASALAFDQPLPVGWPIPVIATAVWIVIFIAIAL